MLLAVATIVAPNTAYIVLDAVVIGLVSAMFAEKRNKLQKHEITVIY